MEYFMYQGTKISKRNDREWCAIVGGDFLIGSVEELTETIDELLFKQQLISNFQQQ